mmetsp:Transcript_1594/g.4107  ORF Transcript_1594/g.4107 Transcript_1594/m.4107 type:complete len:200 (+) Transcript_1594:535-1134(+)
MHARRIDRTNGKFCEISLGTSSCSSLGSISTERWTSLSRPSPCKAALILLGAAKASTSPWPPAMSSSSPTGTSAEGDKKSSSSSLPPSSSKVMERRWLGLGGSLGSFLRFFGGLSSFSELSAFLSSGSTGVCGSGVAFRGFIGIAGAMVPSTAFDKSSLTQLASGPCSPYKSAAGPRKIVSLLISLVSSRMQSIQASKA